MTTIAEQYRYIEERIAEAALKAGREPSEVRLMAVTKTVEADQIKEALSAGAKLLGENKVQELERKRPLLPPCEIHLIGHLQTNKVQKAVAAADMIQSVDSVRLAREISKACEKTGKVMPILLEVNIGRDEAKFGFLPEHLEAALSEIVTFPHLSLRGLMTVPPLTCDGEKTRNFFLQMKQLFVDIRAKKMDNIREREFAFDTLSMGMSEDYELAIAAGATLVRVGSAIFGQRNYR